MTNVYQFTRQKQPPQRTESAIPSAPEKNLHIKEPEDYYLSDVAIGIEIALHLTRDRETAKFLMKKMEQAVNQGNLWVSLDLHETRKYLDYLDIINSKTNQDWRLSVMKFKCTG